MGINKTVGSICIKFKALRAFAIVITVILIIIIVITITINSTITTTLTIRGRSNSNLIITGISIQNRTISVVVLKGQQQLFRWAGLILGEAYRIMDRATVTRLQDTIEGVEDAISMGTLMSMVCMAVESLKGPIVFPVPP